MQGDYSSTMPPPSTSRGSRPGRPATQKKRATRLLAALVAVAPPLHVLAVVDKEVFFAEQPQVYDAPRTLVLAQSVDTFKEGYASLISDLEARGHAVTYASLTQKKTPLFAYGEKLYEHVVLAPGGAAFPAPAVKPPGYRSTQDAIQLEGSQKGRAARSAPLSVTELLKFVDAGGNVAFFGEKPSPDMRKFANECGVDFHRPSTQLWDFAAEDGVTVPARIRTEAAVVVDGDDFPSGVTYRGLTHSVAGSQLTFNVLSGSGSTFVTAADGKTQLVAGESVSLVSAMQARNSARVTFAGSDSLCEENERFCSELTRWAFREKGILRMSNLHSHKVGESVQPYMYRVMDDIVFNIDIEEWKHGEWRPYVANDVQLEFVMLDPHVRLFLDPPEPSQKGSGGSKGGKKTYSKTFKSPDVYGVFKFKIDYARVGYNRLHVEELAPVRNFKHNDYERFIWCAGPYYTSCLLVPVSLLLFVSVFLYHKEDPKKGGKLI